MNWKKGYSASFLAMRVNPKTWQDLEEIKILDGSISRDDSSDLLESASVTMTEAIGEIWVRIYLVARQNGEAARVPLFTGLTSEPTRNIRGNHESYDVECYSVLKPCADKMLPLGWYAAYGSDGTEIIADLFKQCGIKVNSEFGGGYLAANIVAEAGETYLTMAKKVAKAINWQIRPNGLGEVSIVPYSNEVKARFDGENDVVEPAVEDSQDWFSCPNVLRVTSENKTAIFKDEDIKSPLSIPNRGREIWKEENVTLPVGVSLGDYAMLRLKELQAPLRVLKYSRRYDPDVNIGDLVIIGYPGIDGTFRVGSQNVQIGHSCRTEEVAYGT